MYSPEVIINSLTRYYPDVLSDLEKRLNDLLPAPERDLNKLPEIIKQYCSIREIQQESITGRSIEQAFVAYRKELLAVIIMFYQPEKIHGISKRTTHKGLISRTSDILECSGNNLSNFVNEIVVHFKTYESFYFSVTDTYKKIKESLK